MSDLRRIVPRHASIAVVCMIVGQIVALAEGWTVAQIALSIAFLAFMAGHTLGYKEGGDFVQALWLNGRLAEMEEVVEWANEQLGPDDPRRRQAAATLAELRAIAGREQ